MGENFYKKSYVKIETTYPHNLLIHLSRLINNDISLMKDRDKFLDMYSKAYENDHDEMLLLKLAYEKDIVKRFFKYLKEVDWRKHVLVEKTVNVLVEYLEEKYAVLLVESLMFVFGFDFKLEIERKWETPVGERADFHKKMNHISKNELEILDQIKTKEDNGEDELSKERVEQDKFSNDKEEICDKKSDETTDHFDFNEAVKWYSLSTNNGYVKASFALAKLYDQTSHEIPGAKEKAFKIYSDMANQGFPTAQRILGMKYWYGDGVKGDIYKAIEWLKKAAIQRHESAIRSLADSYLSINDMKNARKWYGVGANAGDLYCKDKIRRMVASSEEIAASAETA